MSVSEGVEAKREFSAAVEEALSLATPYPIPGKSWEPTIADGQPLIRVYVGNRWWTLPLRSDTWPHARKAAFESVVSGEALAGELLLYRGLRRTPSGIMCKTVAWLPRSAPIPSQDRIAFSRHNIEEIDIKNLRAAIRANWVSFPSQVPTFPSSVYPELQCKLVQLYFVLGWNCADIAARYGLIEQRARDILHAWKWRAANAGYIEHIPIEQAVNQLKIVSLIRTGTSAPPVSGAVNLP